MKSFDSVSALYHRPVAAAIGTAWHGPIAASGSVSVPPGQEFKFEIHDYDALNVETVLMPMYGLPLVAIDLSSTMILGYPMMAIGRTDVSAGEFPLNTLVRLLGEHFPLARALDLSRCWSLDDRSLVHLRPLTRLRALGIAGLNPREVSDDFLAPLPALRSLEHLDISDNPFTDAGIAHLAGLQALRSVDLSYTRMTRAALACLRTVPRLERLFVGGTALTAAMVNRDLPRVIVVERGPRATEL